jgi:hypothetical protein
MEAGLVAALVGCLLASTPVQEADRRVSEAERAKGVDRPDLDDAW